MSYTYKLNSEKFMKIPKRNVFVQELIDDKIDSTWSVEEICERLRWHSCQDSQESFLRCREWLKQNHSELML